MLSHVVHQNDTDISAMDISQFLAELPGITDVCRAHPATRQFLVLSHVHQSCRGVAAMDSSQCPAELAHPGITDVCRAQLDSS